MAADTPSLTPPELDALSLVLARQPAAVYLQAIGRIYRCPNPFHHPAPCDRTKSFTIPEAQLLAARIRAGELGDYDPRYGPIVLAYGIPWSWT